MSYFKKKRRSFQQGDFSLIEESTDYTVTPSSPVIFTNIILDSYEGCDEVVYVPDNVNVIDCSAFKEKGKLKEVHFPASVNKFFSAFHNCEALEALHFHGTGSIQFGLGAFLGIQRPIRIYFAGSSQVWLESIKPFTDTESSYDNGWGGGAPGLYTKEYINTPMHHQLGEEFYTEVICESDGVTLTVKGVNAPRKLIKSTTPYD